MRALTLVLLLLGASPAHTGDVLIQDERGITTVGRVVEGDLAHSVCHPSGWRNLCLCVWIREFLRCAH